MHITLRSSAVALGIYTLSGLTSVLAESINNCRGQVYFANLPPDGYTFDTDDSALFTDVAGVYWMSGPDECSANMQLFITLTSPSGQDYACGPSEGTSLVAGTDVDEDGNSSNGVTFDCDVSRGAVATPSTSETLTWTLSGYINDNSNPVDASTFDVNPAQAANRALNCLATIQLTSEMYEVTTAGEDFPLAVTWDSDTCDGVYYSVNIVSTGGDKLIYCTPFQSDTLASGNSGDTLTCVSSQPHIQVPGSYSLEYYSTASSVALGGEDDITGDLADFLLIVDQAPDLASCGQSFSLPDYPADDSLPVIDFDATGDDAAETDFNFQLYYDSSVCDSSMAGAYELSNNYGVVYPCSSFVANPEVNVVTITCDRLAGTMSTIATWTISPVYGLQGKRATQALTNLPASDFAITHNDAPSQTGGLRRRSARAQEPLVPSGFVCQRNYLSCPVDGRVDTWECISPKKIESCGGCPNRGGIDCTEIPGVSSVTCDNRKCSVLACESGYTVAANGTTCVTSLAKPAMIAPVPKKRSGKHFGRW